jgi:hypothetical protein
VNKVKKKFRVSQKVGNVKRNAELCSKDTAALSYFILRNGLFTEEADLFKQETGSVPCTSSGYMLSALHRLNVGLVFRVPKVQGRAMEHCISCID